MAKKKIEADEEIKFTKIKGSELPKLVLALIVLFGAVIFILNSLGIFKTAEKNQKLDVLPKPAAVNPSLGADSNGDGRPDTLERISPCVQAAGDILPQPGVNCLVPRYSPDADPIEGAEGRPNPFAN